MKVKISIAFNEISNKNRYKNHPISKPQIIIAILLLHLQDLINNPQINDLSTWDFLTS